jgi:hypothetical protein
MVTVRSCIVGAERGLGLAVASPCGLARVLHSVHVVPIQNAHTLVAWRLVPNAHRHPAAAAVRCAATVLLLCSKIASVQLCSGLPPCATCPSFASVARCTIKTREHVFRCMLTSVRLFVYSFLFYNLHSELLGVMSPFFNIYGCLFKFFLSHGGLSNWICFFSRSGVSPYFIKREKNFSVHNRSRG